MSPLVVPERRRHGSAVVMFLAPGRRPEAPDAWPRSRLDRPRPPTPLGQVRRNHRLGLVSLGSDERGNLGDLNRSAVVPSSVAMRRLPKVSRRNTLTLPMATGPISVKPPLPGGF